MGSSTVPASGEGLAVRCQLMGQYGASGRNQEGGSGRLTSGLATTDKQAIARALGMTMRPGRDPDVTNRGFPHHKYNPSKPGPTLTESPTP